MIYVLDSCAVIAYARDEVGADRVEQVLLEADCVILTTNWAEIYKEFLISKSIEAHSKDTQAFGLRLALAGMGVHFENVIDLQMAETAAALKSMTMGTKGRTIAYCDCFALAYAIKVSGCLLTADGEFELFRQKGYPIEYFRESGKH